MNIGIDIDGVINDLEKFHLDYGCKFCTEQQIDIHLQTNQYKIREMYGWSDEIYQQFKQTYYPFFLRTSSYLRIHAVEVIRRLRSDHKIFILTARQESDISSDSNQTMRSITKQWLRNNHIEFDDFLITSWDKSIAIQEYDINIMIEDSPIFLKNTYLDSKVTYLCYHTNYNKLIAAPNIQRVYSWYNILYTIYRLGEIYE